MAPTTSHVVHSTVIGDDSDLTPATVNATLTRALSKNAYTFTYYLIPDGGYSIVTHMEKFDCETNKGAIIAEDRWVVSDEPLPFHAIFSEGFWRRIFSNKPTGCYRMFVFLVGGRGFSPKGAETWDQPTASLLAQEGWSAFPSEELKDVTYQDGVHCEVLVYQYARYIGLPEAQRIERGDTGAISALRHLSHAAGELLTADEVRLAGTSDNQQGSSGTDGQ